MIQRLIVHCPISSLSLGQVSFNLLRELYRAKIQVSLHPYGNPDLSAFKLDPQFGQWLERAINSRYTRLDRKVPTFSCWHISGSELKLSDRQFLLSFHETDQPTDAELAIVAQQDHTFFSSSWTAANFETFGSRNVSFVPLGLDEDFVPATQRLVSPDITHWVLAGSKFEQRKNTELIIRSWCKRYGGNQKHKLTLAVTNPFFKPEQMNALYQQLFGGKPPSNVNILPLMKTNVEMNAIYNSADICLAGLSGSEAWNIPAHTTTALGKWSIVLNCTAHKDWATAENSVLVEPTGMRPVYDNVFFAQGQPFNQGNIYSVTEERVLEAFERAEKVAKTPNPAGAELRSKHTYANTLSQILAKIGD